MFEGDVVSLTLAGRFWYSNLIAAFNDIITGMMPARAPDARLLSLSNH